LTAFLVSIFPALVVGLFDWITEIIELPHRPVGAAIVGWILAVVALRGFLAMPDLPGMVCRHRPDRRHPGLDLFMGHVEALATARR
jgi:hypothetical protein